jgi:hypothetical protein
MRASAMPAFWPRFMSIRLMRFFFSGAFSAAASFFGSWSLRVDEVDGWIGKWMEDRNQMEKGRSEGELVKM